MVVSKQKDLLSWCDDLHQVKGNISQFQATLQQILNKAPSIEDFKELTECLSMAPSDSKGIADKTRNILTSAQLKVAIRMKFLYDQGLLPFLLALSQINLKSPKSDKFVGYLLDYTPPHDVGDSLSDVLKLRISSKSIDLEQPYPPTLPPIGSVNLLSQVLTDKSFRLPSDFLELYLSSDFTLAHNAKLAVKGRRLLEYSLSEILDSKFPHLHEDDLSYLSNRLASSSILTRLALGYNLVKHYKHNVSKDLPIDDKLKILSKIFLAYIGGLSQSDYSYEEIKAWIAKVYDPIVTRFRENNKFLKPIDDMALAELLFLFERVTNVYHVPPKKTTIEFETLETDPFVVRLTVNNQHLGIGTSSTSEEKAKRNAAAEAYSSKDKLDEILRILMESYEKKDAPPSDDHSPHSNSDESAYSPSLEMEDDYDPSFDMPNMSGSVQASSNGNKASLTILPSSHSPQPYSLPSLPSKPVSGGLQSEKMHHSTDDSQKVPLDTNAKNTLYALLGSNHLTPVYDFTKVGNHFEVAIIVNNKIIGSSKDINKKTASQRAAMNALANIEALALLGVTSQ